MSNFPHKVSSGGYGGESLGLFGETLVPDTIKIEHVFTLKLSDKWERPLRKWIDKWFDLSKDYAESFSYVAAGLGSYFFFLGVSKVVQAGKLSDNSDNSSSCNAKRNKTRSKDRNKKNDVDRNGSSSSSRKVETKETSTTTLSTIPKTTTDEAPILTRNTVVK
eukprot:CAMPEP_0197185632 /NCGR_PEP_ID=MMETSP1423-20130617/12343_1 /TAXON_ID=476441 /ORGANISM="Pseudo-nitzschia heimii, Strain UNC1101" /LENGTH=162 /DNA_ID=CAMNT_0042636751 /DNA_START=84 /DNA_END=573 /DNA_ORIENTATION=+